MGNRTNVDLTEPLIPGFVPGTINYTYNLGNILATAESATYTHDANGNRTNKTNGTTVTSYTYDPLNRLTQVTDGAQTTQYIYNGLGQRVGKIEDGVQTNYLIDPNGALPQVLAEMDDNGDLLAFYVYDGAGLVGKIIPENAYYFYHYDGLGNTVAITDSSGAIVNAYAYSPYGLVGSQETIENSFQYVGKFGVMAEGNGLYFMRARYYDPEVGRFINKDPIGYMGGDLNLYGYVGNNVVNYFDPLGLLVVSPEMVSGWQKSVDYWNYMIDKLFWWLPNFAKEFLCTDLESELISAQVPFGGVEIKAGGKLLPRAISKIEKHHIKPKYLGGDPKGPISKILKDYHQKITNEFRKEFPYGKPYPTTDPAFQQEVEKAMQRIYKKYPLPTP